MNIGLEPPRGYLKLSLISFTGLKIFLYETDKKNVFCEIMSALIPAIPRFICQSQIVRPRTRLDHPLFQSNSWQCLTF